MAAWRALLNLLRAAARDPVWAIFSLVMSPLRLSRHLVVTMLIYVVVWAALTVLWHGVKLVLGIPRLGAINTAATALINIFLLVLLWRLLTTPLVRHFGAQADDATHGSARFASRAETARLAQPTGLLIGRDPKSGRLLRYSGPAHLLTMAPTRSGKGVGTIIPNILTLDRSIVCIDPKGENTRIAARARLRFGPVYVLDPFRACHQLSQTTAAAK